jgi:hypothetical protein
MLDEPIKNLRDEFAMAALNILANVAYDLYPNPKQAAIWSYKVADEMMKTR